MRTTVIHIKDSTGSDDEVYIGRARGAMQTGYFGNPITIGKECVVCGEKHDRGGTLVCYEHWLWAKCKVDKVFADKVRALKGKTLVCFCKPRACHGDVLKKYIEEL